MAQAVSQANVNPSFHADFLSAPANALLELTDETLQVYGLNELQIATLKATVKSFHQPGVRT